MRMHPKPVKFQTPATPKASIMRNAYVKME